MMPIFQTSSGDVSVASDCAIDLSFIWGPDDIRNNPQVARLCRHNVEYIQRLEAERDELRAEVARLTNLDLAWQYRSDCNSPAELNGLLIEVEQDFERFQKEGHQLLARLRLADHLAETLEAAANTLESCRYSELPMAKRCRDDLAAYRAFKNENMDKL